MIWTDRGTSSSSPHLTPCVAAQNCGKKSIVALFMTSTFTVTYDSCVNGQCECSMILCGIAANAPLIDRCWSLSLPASIDLPVWACEPDWTVRKKPRSSLLKEQSKHCHFWWKPSSFSSDTVDNVEEWKMQLWSLGRDYYIKFSFRPDTKYHLYCHLKFQLPPELISHFLTSQTDKRLSLADFSSRGLDT